jgi:hypothetical protein
MIEPAHCSEPPSFVLEVHPRPAGTRLRVSFPSQLRAKFETPSWKQRIDDASGFSGWQESEITTALSEMLANFCAATARKSILYRTYLKIPDCCRSAINEE